MTVEYYHPGLRGVIAGESNISRIADGLEYRGYSVHDLAEGASFLEVAYLLLREELPSEDELADFRSMIVEASELPPAIPIVLETLPFHSSPAEVLRTGISLLAHFNPQAGDAVLDSGVASATRLLATVPMILAAWHRLRHGLAPVLPDQGLGYIGNILQMHTGEVPSALHERALETLFIVCAEHEFNPSSYVSRIAGSTMSGIEGAVLAALSVFVGPAHNCGGEDVDLFLKEIPSSLGAADAVRQRVRETHAVPGFGGRLYDECDPRAAILERICADLAEAAGHGDLEDTADAVERAVWEELHLPPNVDWPMARLLHYLGLPPDLHAGMFVCSRLSGWCAHALEQAESGQVIRPRARYRGIENRSFVPIHKR